MAEDADAPRLLVLKMAIKDERAQVPFDSAAASLMAAVRESGIEPRTREFTLERGTPPSPEAVQELRDYAPTVVVAIGTSATQFAVREFPDVPVVFAMVLYPVQAGIVPSLRRPGGRVTGAAMDIPFELQFKEFRAIAPKAKRLGVLSNPEKTGLVVKTAQAAARKEGFTLIVEPVRKNEEVAKALKRLLKRRIDGLWSVADSTVLLGTAKIILDESALAGIPTMGISVRYCEVGFIFCLSVDAKENGRQAGEVVVKVLRGRDPARIPVALSRNPRLAVNARMADLIGHRFPPGILDRAVDVSR